MVVNKSYDSGSKHRSMTEVKINVTSDISDRPMTVFKTLTLVADIGQNKSCSSDNKHKERTYDSNQATTGTSRPKNLCQSSILTK